MPRPMQTASKNSTVLLPDSNVSAFRVKVRRRGWANLRLGIDVNSDQSLNLAVPGRLWILDASPFGVSGGTYAGLKPSLAF
jgi:hypothetical protein